MARSAVAAVAAVGAAVHGAWHGIALQLWALLLLLLCLAPRESTGTPTVLRRTTRCVSWWTTGVRVRRRRWAVPTVPPGCTSTMPTRISSAGPPNPVKFLDVQERRQGSPIHGWDSPHLGAT